MSRLFFVFILAPLVNFATDTNVTMDQVAKHASNKDCWIVIDGQVYDISNYIPKHPAPQEALVKYCGKNADHGWKTKDANKTHSRSATRLLNRYKIGSLAK